MVGWNSRRTLTDNVEGTDTRTHGSCFPLPVDRGELFVTHGEGERKRGREGRVGANSLTEIRSEKETMTVFQDVIKVRNQYGGEVGVRSA